MADNNVDLILYPTDAAFQAVLEMAKAGAFNLHNDKGAAFIGAFNIINAKFKEVSKHETPKSADSFRSGNNVVGHLR